MCQECPLSCLQEASDCAAGHGYEQPESLSVRLRGPPPGLRSCGGVVCLSNHHPNMQASFGGPDTGFGSRSQQYGPRFPL